MTKTLRVALLMNKENWTSLPKKLENIQKELDEHLNGKLKLDFSVAVTHINAESAPWHQDDEQKEGVKFIDNDWLLENVHRRATCHDIVCFHIENENWQSIWKGYAKGSEIIDGIETIVMTSKERGRRRGKDEFTSRFIHELCHSLVDMAEIRDEVHKYDYRKPSEWWKSLKKVKFDKLKGWNAQEGTRIFKWVNGKLKQKFITHKQSAMYQSLINYWYKAGGYKNTF